MMDSIEEMMQLRRGFDSKRPADIRWAQDPERLRAEAEKRRLNTQQNPQMSTLATDLESAAQKREQMGALEAQQNEYLMKIAEFKKDLARPRAAPIASEVGVSLLDNPFLLEGANTEQVARMDPTQTEQRLEKLQEKEEALTKVMARLPINEELYANMLSELKVVAQERQDAERDYLEIQLKENPDVVLGEAEEGKRRKRIRDKLMKAVETGKKGETRLDYKPFDGFYVFVDFVLDIPRKFDRVYMTYKLVSPSTEESYPEVKTLVKTLDRAGANMYKVAIAEKHRFTGAKPSEDAYLLFRFWVEEMFQKWDPHEFDDLLKIPDEDPGIPMIEDKRFVVYGWSPFKVFYKKKVM